VLNRQHSSKNINILLKLYKSTYSKCRYTSLELAVMGFSANGSDTITNFPTNNVVKVGSRDHNKEQCHRFWQCQTIVDC